MEFRSAIESDFESIISWIENSDDCLTWAGPDVTFPMIPTALKRQIEYTAGNSYCLLDKTEPVAFGQLLQKGEYHYHLARIIVAPVSRGRGYGYKICKHLIKRAHACDSRRLTLNVYRDNQRAIGLYRHLGFVPAPPPDSMKVPEGVVHMRLEEKWKTESSK